MKLIRFLATITLLAPSIAYSEDEPGRLRLGVGFYLMELYDEAVLSGREAQYGGVLSVGYLINNNFVLHGNYYSLSSGDFDDTDIEGSEILIYYGRDLTKRGVQQSIGGGYFSEDWDDSTGSKSLDGLQLGYGIGYNWDDTSITALIHFRDSIEYDDTLTQLEDEINSVFVLSVIFSTRL